MGDALGSRRSRRGVFPSFPFQHSPPPPPDDFSTSCDPDRRIYIDAASTMLGTAIAHAACARQLRPLVISMPTTLWRGSVRWTAGIRLGADTSRSAIHARAPAPACCGLCANDEADVVEVSQRTDMRWPRPLCGWRVDWGQSRTSVARAGTRCRPRRIVLSMTTTRWRGGAHCGGLMLSCAGSNRSAVSGICGCRSLRSPAGGLRTASMTRTAAVGSLRDLEDFPA